MVSNGLPIHRRRQKHNDQDDIIAGEDFLEVIMRSAAFQEINDIVTTIRSPIQEEKSVKTISDAIEEGIFDTTINPITKENSKVTPRSKKNFEVKTNPIYKTNSQDYKTLSGTIYESTARPIFKTTSHPIPKMTINSIFKASRNAIFKTTISPVFKAIINPVFKISSKIISEASISQNDEPTIRPIDKTSIGSIPKMTIDSIDKITISSTDKFVVDSIDKTTIYSNDKILRDLLENHSKKTTNSPIDKVLSILKETSATSSVEKTTVNPNQKITHKTTVSLIDNTSVNPIPQIISSTENSNISTNQKTTKTISKSSSITKNTSDFPQVIRHTRSTPYFAPPSHRSYSNHHGHLTQPFGRNRFNNYDRRVDNNDLGLESGQEDETEEMVITVSVSSSVGQGKQRSEEEKIEAATTYSPLRFFDKGFVKTEERPSLVAETIKTEFSVEESEPITSLSGQLGLEYPAGVSRLNKPSHREAYTEKYQESARGRSVSHGTLQQNLSGNRRVDLWNGDKIQNHNREERHYESSINGFNSNRYQYVPKQNESATNIGDKEQSPSFLIKNEANLVTNKFNPLGFTESSLEIWEQPRSTTPISETTEKNWGQPESNYGVQQKPHQNLPIVYGRPEENYEVDEAVSVMTNGRAHGIQPVPQSTTKTYEKPNQKINQHKKQNDNQKVGYVVEGRNYRKYRVEERTSDGFIVGEYGVVSHDDGSLRGVRYTADGTISPRLIYDALMKFLSL